MSTETIYAHIARTPGICGGRPRIEGHRIRVQDVAIEHEWQAMTPEEICHQHPGLTLAEVHSALAYYYDHREAIRAEIEADRAAVEAFRRRDPQEVVRAKTSASSARDRTVTLGSIPQGS